VTVDRSTTRYRCCDVPTLTEATINEQNVRSLTGRVSRLTF